MGLEPWWLDLWAYMAMFTTGIGLLFALIGLIAVAVEGPEAWHDGFTLVVLGFPVVGILFPLIVLVPFVGIYRLIRRK